MAKISRSTQKGYANNRLSLGGKLVPCKVKDIILDPNTPRAKQLGGHSAIGTIYYNKIKMINES